MEETNVPKKLMLTSSHRVSDSILDPNEIPGHSQQSIRKLQNKPKEEGVFFTAEIHFQRP
jgi:hypothetical protein